jgi:SAM-dependent methyltransferase
MVKCNCTSKQLLNPINIYSSFYSSGRSYRYLKCSGCLSLFWDDIEDSITYDNTYYSFQEKSSRKLSHLEKQRYLGKSTLAKIMRICFPLSLMNTIVFDSLRNNRYNILDYGSGSGGFTRFLEQLEYDGKIVSYDPFYDGHNVNILTEKAQIGWEDIGMVYCNQVFEHVVDLNALLLEIFEKAKLGTVLIFSMPLLGSLVRQFGELAYVLQVPDHKSLYTQKGLKALLKQLPWETISMHVEDLHSEYGKLSVPIDDNNYRRDIFIADDYVGGNNAVVMLKKLYE